MGIFDFLKGGKPAGVDFKPLLKKQFITEEQYRKLVSFTEQNKPHSNILDDLSPECLHAYIAEKFGHLYNNVYFKRSYFSYTGRQPYWVAEEMDNETKKKINTDHKNLLDCLYRSGLVSRLTFDKLYRKTEEGLIYKLWEITTISQALTAYEEELKKINAVAELNHLIKHGIVTPDDGDIIIGRIQKGEINERAEVIRWFGKKITIPGHIRDGDIKKAITRLLDSCLGSLPFHQSHVINAIDEYDLADPHHKTYMLKHTSITLAFNEKKYVFPFNTSNNFYRIAPGFSIGMISGILMHLCREHGDQYQVITLKDHFLNQHHITNDNIEAYYILLVKKGFGHSFFLKEKMPDSIFSHLPVAAKENFLTALFGLFDPGRFSEADRVFTAKNVINSALENQALIPDFVPGLIHIIWYDILSDTYTYRDILTGLAGISNNRFNPTSVTDDFAQADDGGMFTLSMAINSKTYRIGLKKGTVDYDLFRLLHQVQTENDLGGKFYIFTESGIQDGYAVIFLSADEKQRLDDLQLFGVQEMSSEGNY